MDDGNAGRLRDLHEDECRALLAGHRVGRLAWNDPARGPVVLPVSYRFDGEHVLVRTSAHTELARHFTVGRMAFEIDDYNEATHTGWSVLVRGVATVTPPGQAPSVEDDPAPVVGGTRTFHIQVTVEQITGRRVLPT